MRRKTLAIPLRCNDWSNTSQVVSLLTPEQGLVDGVAKGAYRPKSSFQGPFDLAELREVIYVEKRPPALAIITESAVLDGFRGLRRSWSRFVAGATILELLRAVSLPGEPAVEIFHLAERSLRGIAEDPADRLSAQLLSFEVRALSLLGFLAPIDACVLCRRPWPGGRAAYFSPRAGGLLCRRCRGGIEGAEVVPGGAVQALHSLAVDGPLAQAPWPEPSVAPRLHALLSSCATFFLERSFEMLKYSAAWL
ncbi:MAG: DNA repair protein RecO [Planctomycetes bacterium]|nr:DNA repair protein RecO [Planctomycetota bacterium]